jgi:site-specific DNA-methyltransferase (cytosine-N4-specific)
VSIDTLVFRLKPYIQPFERELALAELARLANTRPRPANSANSDAHDFIVRTNVSPASLAERLSYWESVVGTAPQLTTQVLREATVNVVRNGITTSQIRAAIPFNGNVPLPNRRCLRYGPHGIHEYRGKFFPQLVRALVNVGGVRRGGLIADTMCGSGTTLVEAALIGCDSIGLDMNPLSVLMTRTKCGLLHADADSLEATYNRVKSAILESRGRRHRLRWLSSLPDSDQRYLRNWFPEQVLSELEHITGIVASVRDTTERNLLWLSLSNILRRVSWQKEDDLRARRDVHRDIELDPVKEFLDELGRSVRLMLAFLLQCRDARLGRGTVLEGDARAADKVLQSRAGKVDAVITSPPYATALPYLDTDRLSLLFLRLLSRPEHRRRDLIMIGNREITERTRRSYWEAYKAQRSKLPGAIVRLVERVHRLNADANVGFRRRNLPALLARYFVDIEQVFEALHVLLRRHHPAYVVVGNNHTYAGGQRVEIETARLLADLAETRGFKCEEMIPMEMLVSRDIFKKNAVASETIVCLRKV